VYWVRPCSIRRRATGLPDKLMLSDYLAATRRGDLITLSGCGSLVTITPAEVDTLARWANDDAHPQRFPCPDPDAEPNWLE
jgi:hypothetical protein